MNCQKRTVVCVLYNEYNEVLSLGTNKCSPEGGTCLRLGVVQDKENYTNDCNSVHAEIDAINKLPEKGFPVKAFLEGHDFFCQPCEDALRKIGIREFEICQE